VIALRRLKVVMAAHTGRFLQVGAHAVGAGSEALRANPLLRRRLRIPPSRGQSEASGVGWQRHGAVTKWLHQGASLGRDPRRRVYLSATQPHDAAFDGLD